MQDGSRDPDLRRRRRRRLPLVWAFAHRCAAAEPGRAGAGPAGAGLRLAGLPQPGHRRLPVDPDAGDDAGAGAVPVPERQRAARQQRPLGPAEHPRSGPCGPGALSIWFFWASAAGAGAGLRAGRLAGRRASSAVVVRAIRDDEARVRFLGYPVEGYKLVVFTLTAMITAIAGALYYPQAGIINPAELAPIASIYLAVWVAIGGRGRLYGAAIGAVVVSLLSSWFTGGRAPSINLLGFYAVELGRLVAGRCLAWPSCGHAVRAQGNRRDLRLAGGALPPRRQGRDMGPNDGAFAGEARPRHERTSGGQRRLQVLRRVQGDQQPVVLDRRGRAAGGDRAERRGQDHLHGHRDRQDPARRGRGAVGRGIPLASQA